MTAGAKARRVHRARGCLSDGLLLYYVGKDSMKLKDEFIWHLHHVIFTYDAYLDSW